MSWPSQFMSGGSSDPAAWDIVVCQLTVKRKP